jgi:hypothetical protein
MPGVCSLFFSIASAGVLVGLLPGTSEPEPVSAPEPPAAQAASASPITQDGTVVALTPDSVTTRSDNGALQTYRITPDTTAVTIDATSAGSAASSFAVDDKVSVVATVNAGQAVATAVADQAASRLNGPPMDYLVNP